MARTLNLYKAATFRQVFSNAPKEVSKQHVGLASYSYSLLNVRKQCCRDFRRQLEGTQTKENISLKMAAGGTPSVARRVLQSW